MGKKLLLISMFLACGTLFTYEKWFELVPMIADSVSQSRIPALVQKLTVGNKQPKLGNTPAGKSAKAAKGTAAETPASENATFYMDQADEELALISQNARDTLPTFFRHYLRPEEGEGNFRIKYPFRADPESGFSMEQLWLSDIRYKDGVYYGIIANTPFYAITVKKGDETAFSADDITDWMFTQNGKIVGGLSIKYLLEQIHDHNLSEEQLAVLKMFDSE